MKALHLAESGVISKRSLSERHCKEPQNERWRRSTEITSREEPDEEIDRFPHYPRFGILGAKRERDGGDMMRSAMMERFLQYNWGSPFVDKMLEGSTEEWEGRCPPPMKWLRCRSRWGHIPSKLLLSLGDHRPMSTAHSVTNASYSDGDMSLFTMTCAGEER